jgi:ABC-type Mn2+/Zn2+ transport system permease subunit
MVIPRDAVLGTVFVSAVAGRILILQKAPRVEAAEIENLLRGDILFVTPDLFVLMAGAFLAAMGLHLLFFKEFTYISFDPETARTQGLKAGWWDLLFYVLAAGVISFATHMVGDVFVFGFLVIPPVSAILLCRRVTMIFAVSALLGALAPVVGLLLAFTFDFPSSPAIVAVVFCFLLLSWVVHRIRER